MTQDATMQPADGLVLRDIHAASAPSWWPPAPGWWLLLAVVVAAAAIVLALRLRRRHRARAIARLFDDALAQADSPTAQIAAISELLRRAARLRDPDADTLQGDDWLRFLDAGLKQPVFTTGMGAVLVEGAFRRDVSEADVASLRTLARMRFLQWMGAGR
jgi:hypothetical protein